MTEQPEDLYLKTAAACAWLNKDEARAYLAGVRTAINLAELLTVHGETNALQETWKYLVYGNYKEFPIELVVEKMRRHFDDGALWLTADIFELQEMRAVRHHSIGSGQVGYQLLLVYRYLARHFKPEKLQNLYNDYLPNLRLGLDRIEASL